MQTNGARIPHLRLVDGDHPNTLDFLNNLDRNQFSTTRSSVTQKSTHRGLSERLSHYFKQVEECDNETSESGGLHNFSDFSDSDVSMPMGDVMQKRAFTNITSLTLNHQSLESSPRRPSSRYSTIQEAKAQGVSESLQFEDFAVKILTPQLGSPQHAPKALEHQSLSPKNSARLGYSRRVLDQMNGVSQSAECVKHMFLKSPSQKTKTPRSPCSLFQINKKLQQKKKNPVLQMKQKLLRNACKTPKPEKRTTIFLTTPSRSVSLLDSRDGINAPSRQQASRSPVMRDPQLSILDKCLKNSNLLMSQMASIDLLLKKNGDSIKEFQLSGVLRKMKQMQRLCEEIQEKLGYKENRSISPFRLERKKLIRKDLKKIVKHSRYPAQKKIFELVK